MEIFIYKLYHESEQIENGVIWSLMPFPAFVQEHDMGIVYLQ